MFRRLFQGVSRTTTWRLHSQCAVCHAWPAQPVCEPCRSLFGQPVPRCATCARPVLANMRQCGACITQPPPLDRCLAAVSYAYPWSTLLVDFKFQEHPSWAPRFATLMRGAPGADAALETADLVIPMPLSRQRLRTRGFNQALLLARALESSKVVADVLLRIVDTPPQSSLPRKERLASVQNAFAVEPLQAHRLQGKNVVLVDDVMTSGASLHGAAKVLRRAGVTYLTALVFARTE